MSMNGEDRKGELFQMRLDAAEKQGFQQAADLTGLTLSAWVRERLRRVAARELEEARQIVPFLNRSKDESNG